MDHGDGSEFLLPGHCDVFEEGFVPAAQVQLKLRLWRISHHGSFHLIVKACYQDREVQIMCSPRLD